MADSKIMIAMGLAVLAVLLSGVSLMKAPAADAEGPTTEYLSIRVGEGVVLGEGEEPAMAEEGELMEEVGEEPAAGEEEEHGEQVIIGEFHRWEPDHLVVRLGDTVVLTVTNPHDDAHSLVIPDFGVNSGRLEPGGEATVTFVADREGTFPFSCGITHDPELGNCAPDHKYQTGFLTVLR